MKTYDFKKEQKAYYTTKEEPHYIEIPAMTYIMVEGSGDPNEEHGDYQKAIQLLYALSYAIRMSYKSDTQIPGYYPYTVAPLEGLWTFRDDSTSFSSDNKQNLGWISMIHQPDFVNETIFQWACEQVERKKKLDTSIARLRIYEEGLCIQMMHRGSYDEEVHSFQKMETMMKKDGYLPDVHLENYHHHEIYLKDNRNPDPSSWKTILRQKVKRSKENTENV